jgi:putative tryptophan/tyrosine transport system substrate-binding protein
MELLHTIVPNATLVGLLVNPDATAFTTGAEALAHAAATKLGQKIEIVTARNEGGVYAAFATLANKHADALLVAADEFLASETGLITRLAARYALPAVYPLRVYAAAGGLASYGASLAEVNRLDGDYVGRILAGAKPADLPVMQTTKFELVINLKTAKAQDIMIPPTLLATADEVIE